MTVEIEWLELDQDAIATLEDENLFQHAVARGPFNPIGPVILRYREDEGEWKVAEIKGPGYRGR